LEDFDRELNDGEAVEIGVNNEVGNVSVDEDFAGSESNDLVGGDSGIATADPKELWRLLLGEFAEKFWFGGADAIGPIAVLAEKVLNSSHQGSSVGFSRDRQR